MSGGAACLRRSDAVIRRDDIFNALDRITVGLREQLSPSMRERRSAQAGHAIVGQAIEEFDNVSHVTIVPRSSGAGGFTTFTPDESRNVNGLYTRDYLEAKLAVLLAGRAAEALVLGEDTISVGASNDLQRARGLAASRRVGTRWFRAPHERQRTHASPHRRTSRNPPGYGVLSCDLHFEREP